MLYGASLLLEFAALVALRIREPELPRPVRVPGGLPGAVLFGVPPLALLGLALWRCQAESICWLPAPLFALGLGLFGIGFYRVRAVRAA